MKDLFQAALIALLLAPSASAEPSNGYLTGTNDFIQYSCSAESAFTVTCKFTQVKLQLRAKPEDLQERLSKVDERMSEFSEDALGDVCGETAKFPLSEILLAARKGDVTRLEEIGASLPDFDAEEIISKVSDSDPRVVEDMLQSMEAILSLCDGVTREKIENMARLEYEKDAKTCKLWINPWEDTFERVSDRIWSIQSGGPRGECGVVRLDRFECEEKSPSLCNFISEKRILNKDGGTLFSCSDLDEASYEYRWNADDIYPSCVSISFP